MKIFGKPFSGPWPLSANEQLYEQGENESDDIYWLRVIALNTAATTRRTSYILAIAVYSLFYWLLRA